MGLLLLQGHPPQSGSPPLLDSLPDTAVALSIRLLRTAYAGACMRVTRSNDSAQQDIGFASGLLDLAALATFVGANSAIVEIWYDQSGNGRNLLPIPASANAARIVNAGVVDTVGSRPAPYWPGVNQAMRVAPFGLVQPWTKSMAWKVGTYDAAEDFGLNNVVDGTSPATITFRRNSAVAMDIYAGGLLSGSYPAANTEAMLTAIVANGASSAATKNGSPNATGNIGAGNPDGLIFGADISGGRYGQFWLSEFIAFASDQTASLATLATNQMAYFGLS